MLVIVVVDVVLIVVFVVGVLGEYVDMWCDGVVEVKVDVDYVVVVVGIVD